MGKNFNIYTGTIHKILNPFIIYLHLIWPPWYLKQGVRAIYSAIGATPFSSHSTGRPSTIDPDSLLFQAIELHISFFLDYASSKSELMIF